MQKKFSIKTKILTSALGVFLAVGFIRIASTRAMSIMIHVPEKYTEVQVGERFYFELEIKYPENATRKDLRLEYEILEDGEVVARSKFLKAIETQASFMDYIVIPESAHDGLHEIRVRVNDYDGDLNEEVSATFKVIQKDNEIKVYFYVIVGMIILSGIIISWEISRLRKVR